MKHVILLIAALLLPLAAGAQVQFEASVVADGFDGAVGVSTADLDNDGDLDILGAAESGDSFAWWENDNLTWIEHTLDTNADGASDLTAADIDSDGDMDMIGVSYQDVVRWYENDGAGGFTIHLITTWTDAKTVIPWDVDEDGDLDLMMSSNMTDQVLWLENTGDALVWPMHLIATGFDGAWGLVVEDFDGDGDVDAASCARHGDMVAWWENTGAGWTEHVIGTGIDYPHGMDGRDVDGDGSFDLAVAARNDDSITLFFNDGAGGFTQSLLTDTFDGADDVHLADIDLDGMVDVIGAATTADEVRWWKQLDNGWTTFLIDDTFDYASGVYASDIDDDGDPDVLAAGYYADQIMLYTQLGSPDPDPVTVELTPVGNTAIPADGGTLTYDVNLVSTLGGSFPGVSFWTMVELPNGTMYGPLFQQSFTLQPFMNVTVTGLTQYVPAAAPPGGYGFYGFVGYMGNPDLQISDFFIFSKGGAAANSVGDATRSWKAGGSFDVTGDRSSEPAVPSEYALSAAYPNPFNPSTQIRVSLPETAPLAVTVVNVQGRVVAELANGQRAAGEHTLVFDAHGLSSGVYFVRALVPGHLDATQKVLLVR